MPRRKLKEGRASRGLGALTGREAAEARRQITGEEQATPRRSKEPKESPAARESRQRVMRELREGAARAKASRAREKEARQTPRPASTSGVAAAGGRAQARSRAPEIRGGSSSDNAFRSSQGAPFAHGASTAAGRRALEAAEATPRGNAAAHKKATEIGLSHKGATHSNRGRETGHTSRAAQAHSPRSAADRVNHTEAAARPAKGAGSRSKGTVQQGAKGGKFILLPSGRKRYVK